ncbi:MAG: M14 family metallopeptidase [Chitinophagaceae bacterium]
MNKIIALLLCCFSVLTVAAQLQSPEQFLGYKLGSRYTPHWKVVSYFNHVAASMNKNVKLQTYGVTNEGRTLMVAFLASEENLSNLENIRLNNLRLANLAKDKMAPQENAPGIVWLSYNVHGNETSSSEAAMLTIYSLLDPSNSKSKDWLKNTVVVIDPCINPDGRDRYVNWYTSVVGKNANARMDTREHREPWPGGRTNHYNFDLNRDWAWQTQVESQQRVQLYNQWMPQIHVDFHEQGINEPYYFAPAAEPFHEVITPWQRDFQTIIGKNHAKYFDANGWLYFTKLRFDLFYPSYGDTYPTYNGAIGMTFEQGGHSQGGTAAITEEGDTLTLYDRLIHHFTTGMSTVEMGSANNAKMMSEFRSFFNKGVSAGFGEYKTYIIKNNPKDEQRIKAFLELLDKNGIQYGSANGAAKGYNYHTGKEEAFTIAAGDVVVSAIQPRSAMVQVLLEPKSKLSDSATYDITAWSLPYAYGLTAFATKDKLSVVNYNKPSPPNNTPSDVYAYVLKWDGVQSAKAAGELLKKGVVLRYSETPFEVDGQSFDRGSMIVMKTSNTEFGSNLWKMVADACNAAGIKAFPVSTGFVKSGGDFGSDIVHPIKHKRVVLLTGEGVNGNAAGEIWHFFDAQLQYPISLVNANDIGRLKWNETDIIIMPDGNYRFLNDKAQADALKEWISKGGRVIALENAVNAFARLEWGLKSKKTDEEKSKDPYDPLKSFENRERDFISSFTPGSVYRVELDNTHPLAFGYPKYYYTLKQDDNIFEFFTPGSGWNVGVIKKDAQLAGFVGNKLKERLKDGLLFGVQDMGNGGIVYFTDNILFRSFWENGKLMLCNAVFF